MGGAISILGATRDRHGANMVSVDTACLCVNKSFASCSVGPCVIPCQMFVKSEFPLDSALV